MNRDICDVPGTGVQVQKQKVISMNEATVPSLVDMDKLGAEILPAEVTKFAPEKYRTSSTLSQTANDLRKKINNVLRKNDEHTAWLKQECDEILRMIG